MGPTKVIPVAVVKQSVNTGPRPFVNGKKYCIQHSELVGLVSSVVGFGTNGFTVNPGIDATFPWLNLQAAGYEKYAFRKLAFEYRSRRGYNTDGTVIMYFDHDVKDLPPASYVQASTMAGAKSTNPYVSRTLDIKGGGLGQTRFVRASDFTINGDASLYDAGTLFVSTQGDASETWGELWAHYTVEFTLPQTKTNGDPVPAPGRNISTILENLGGAIAPSVTATVNPIIQGTLPSIAYNSLGAAVDTKNGTVQVPVDGTYKVTSLFSNLVDFAAVGPMVSNWFTDVDDPVTGGVSYSSKFDGGSLWDTGAGTYDSVGSFSDSWVHYLHKDTVLTPLLLYNLAASLPITFQPGSFEVELLDKLPLSAAQIEQKKLRDEGENKWHAKVQRRILSTAEKRASPSEPQRAGPTTSQPAREGWWTVASAGDNPSGK